MVDFPTEPPDVLFCLKNISPKADIQVKSYKYLPKWKAAGSEAVSLHTW